MHVKKGDTVAVISGRDAHVREGGKKITKTGKVLAAFPESGTIIVEGVNIRTRATKPRGQGAGQQGGLMKREMAINASKVMLYCGKCKQPTRVGHKMVGDKKVRVCVRKVGDKPCGNVLD